MAWASEMALPAANGLNSVPNRQDEGPAKTDDVAAASAAVHAAVGGIALGCAAGAAAAAAIGVCDDPIGDAAGDAKSKPQFSAGWKARAWTLWTLPLVLSTVSAESETEKEMEQHEVRTKFAAPELAVKRDEKMTDLKVRTLPSRLKPNRPAVADPTTCAAPAFGSAGIVEGPMWADPQPLLDELTRRGVWAVADYNDDGTAEVRVKRTTPEADARAVANLPKVPGVTFRLFTAAESAARDRAIMAKFALETYDDEADDGTTARAAARHTPRVVLAAH